MNIGQAASKSGLTVKAIRFYEQEKVITSPVRGSNGYRYYTKEHLRELILVHQARQTGFSLDECREMINWLNDPSRHSVDIKIKTLKKVAEIDAQIQALGAMRKYLLQLAATCPGDENSDCPIINRLTCRESPPELS